MSMDNPDDKNSSQEVNEPAAEYRHRSFTFFNSFEEQEEYELKQMSLLSPVEILQQLRRFVNTAYGMHGYDPEKLPQIHTVRIVKASDEHI
jgi:hypothetical protein